MKKQFLSTLWAFSALLAMSQPPLRDTNTIVLKDNTTFIIDSNYVAHHTPAEIGSNKADTSKKKVRPHEVHKNYRYEVKTSSSSRKTKSSASSKQEKSSERQ